MQCSLILFNIFNLASSLTVRYRAVEAPDFYKILTKKPTCGPIQFPDYSCEQTSCSPVNTGPYDALDANAETICDTIPPPTTPSSSSPDPPALRIAAQPARPPPPPGDAEPLRNIVGQRGVAPFFNDALLRTMKPHKLKYSYKRVQEIRGTTSTMPPFDVPPKPEGEDTDEDGLPDQQKPKCGGLAACREQTWR